MTVIIKFFFFFLLWAKLLLLLALRLFYFLSIINTQICNCFDIVKATILFASTFSVHYNHFQDI